MNPNNSVIKRLWCNNKRLYASVVQSQADFFLQWNLGVEAPDPQLGERQPFL